jgi:hypothetical protein
MLHHIMHGNIRYRATSLSQCVPIYFEAEYKPYKVWPYSIYMRPLLSYKAQSMMMSDVYYAVLYWIEKHHVVYRVCLLLFYAATEQIHSSESAKHDRVDRESTSLVL